MQHTALKIVGVICGVIYLGSLFAFSGMEANNAPDENATSFFISQVRDGDLPRVEEKRNRELFNAIHPRSTTVVGDYIVPIGFVGIPMWYGMLLRGLPASIPNELPTAILIVLAGIAWFKIQEKYLGEKELALISTVLLFTLPPFWYYATRGLMPNVPFVCTLILAFYAVDMGFCKRYKMQWLNLLIGGGLLGVAISIRMSEIPWLMLAVAGYAIIKKKELSAEKVVIGCIGVAIALLPVFALQNTIYGAWQETGYTVKNQVSYEQGVMSESVSAFQTSAEIVEKNRVDRIFGEVLPFGFHEKLIVKHVFENVFILLPLVAALGTLGVVYAWWNKREWRLYIITLALVATWLFVLYGSWSINDNPDPFAVTLGNSYSRYWLPIYIGLIPLIAIAINEIGKVGKSKKSALVICMVLGWMVFGGASITRGEDGFFAMRQRLLQYDKDANIVKEEVPEDALLITHYADKYLFPSRDVIIGLTAESTIQALPRVLEEYETYYFGLSLPQKDINFYQENVLDMLPEPHVLTEIRTIRDHTLYKFERL